MKLWSWGVPPGAQRARRRNAELAHCVFGFRNKINFSVPYLLFSAKICANRLSGEQFPSGTPHPLRRRATE